MPALLGALIPTLIIAYFLFAPGDLANLGESTLAQSLLVANVYFWRETGYFAGPAELRPLLHTWSLAVEEQFYLLFPIILFLIHKFARRLVLAAFLIAAALSFAANLYLIQRSPSATFFLIPTRAWELLAGSIIASFPMVSIKRSIAEVGSWVGLVAIVGSMFAYTKSTTFPGAAAAVPVLGTAAIIFFNTSHLTASGRLLAAKPLVGIGLISYSLYLWHWPIFVFLRYVKVDVTPPYFMGACLLSIFLAWLSYRFVEQPFRKTKVNELGIWNYCFIYCPVLKEKKRPDKIQPYTK